MSGALSAQVCAGEVQSFVLGHTFTAVASLKTKRCRIIMYSQFFAQPSDPLVCKDAVFGRDENVVGQEVCIRKKSFPFLLYYKASD